MDVTYPEKYHRATRYFDSIVGDLEQSSQLDNERKLLFYALRQQADVGPCTQPAPSLWCVTERYKHHAWCRLGNMSRAEAMVHFVRQVEQMVGMPLRWSQMPPSDMYDPAAHASSDMDDGGKSGEDDDGDDSEASAPERCGDASTTTRQAAEAAAATVVDDNDDDVLVTRTCVRDRDAWHDDLRAHATPTEANVVYLISQAMHARRLYRDAVRQHAATAATTTATMTTTTSTTSQSSTTHAHTRDDRDAPAAAPPPTMQAALAVDTRRDEATIASHVTPVHAPCTPPPPPPAEAAAAQEQLSSSSSAPQQQRVAVRVLANGVQIRVPCAVHHTHRSQATRATRTATALREQQQQEQQQKQATAATPAERTRWLAWLRCNEGLVAALERERLLCTAAVAAAMRRVDRRWFVPHTLAQRAYDDTPLPIGHAATISAPHMHAMMLELLYPYIRQYFDDDDESSRRGSAAATARTARGGVAPLRVLDVGSGSGYLTAVLAALCDRDAAAVHSSGGSSSSDDHTAAPSWQVYGIEHVPSLQQRSLAVLQTHFASWLERGCVRVVCGDGRSPARALSLADDAAEQFHLIHVGAAADGGVPAALLRLLRRGGCIVIPVGPSGGTQRLLCCTKDDAGVVHERTTSHVVFVPLTSLALQEQAS